MSKGPGSTKSVNNSTASATRTTAPASSGGGNIQNTNAVKVITIKNSYGGGTRQMSLSTDTEVNDVMKALSGYLSIKPGTNAIKVDDYIRKIDGGYELKLSSITGRAWGTQYPFGKLTYVKSNEDHRLVIRKINGKWQGEHIQRRYYGLAPIVKRIF